MTYELLWLLSGREIRLNKGCRNPVFAEVANTIHQAIGVYMHWVILGMELELAHGT